MDNNWVAQKAAYLGAAKVFQSVECSVNCWDKPTAVQWVGMRAQRLALHSDATMADKLADQREC